MRLPTNIEREIIRLAKQIGREARGGAPLGADYADIPSWTEWREQAWEELVLKYARKNPNQIKRTINAWLNLSSRSKTT